MGKLTKGKAFLRLIMLMLILLAASNLNAVDPSYELYVKKTIIDGFSIHEYANKDNLISSVHIANPTIDADKYIADIYISTEKKVSFDVTSLGGFALKRAGGNQKIPYLLYAVTEISPNPFWIRGTASRFQVKNANTVFDNDFAFSLKLRLDNPTTLASVSGEYTDTLFLTMVVDE